MATTPSKGKGKKGSQRRMLLALGLVALVVVGYLWYRSKGASSLAASPSGASASGFPAAGSDTGGASGSGAQGLDAGTGLLSSLAGENQGLLDSLLKTEQGLLSLVGSSVGAPSAAAQTVAEPAASLPQAPAPAPAAAPAAAPAVSSQSAPLTAAAQADFGTYPVIDFTPPPPGPPPDLGPAQITSQSGPDVGGYQGAPIIDFSPPPQDTSGAQDIGSDILAGAANPEPPAPVYSPPVYGITYGPPAGERATSGSKGVQSIH